MMRLITVFACLVSGLLGQELLQNGDMETMDGWHCWGFSCSITETHQSGNYAIQTKDRTRKWHGPTQFINVTPGNRYSVSVYVHLVNDVPGELGQQIVATMQFKFEDGSSKYKPVAFQRMLRTKDGWVRMQGDFIVPTNKPLKWSRFYMQGPPGGVDFITDNASVQPLLEWSTWRNDTDSSINKLRKSDINIQVQTATGVDPKQVEVEVVQTKKSYPFGTAINCREYHNGDTRYQDFINQHFNWAVTENCLKWKAMERKQGKINYSRAFNAINKLRSNGIKVRGHNIVWSPEKHVPDWVKAFSGEELKEVVKTRIVGVVNTTKSVVEHWDVNNENLHGFYFQEKVHDLDYNLDIFKMAHDTAPNVKMFLNDFNIIPNGLSVGAYTTQALQFKNANVGLYGVGVQCHFDDDKSPDPTVMKAHLDMLAQAGVPIWVTELDVASSDENTRADYYETALRVLYAHPAVEGIMLWGGGGDHAVGVLGETTLAWRPCGTGQRRRLHLKCRWRAFLGSG